jgi:hypothetical protein
VISVSHETASSSLAPFAMTLSNVSDAHQSYIKEPLIYSEIHRRVRRAHRKEQASDCFMVRMAHPTSTALQEIVN